MRFVRIAIAVVTVSAATLLPACSGSDNASSGDAAPWVRLEPPELQSMLAEQDVFLVNVHVPYEGEIPGTDAFIPYTEIASRIDELPTGGQTPIVLYCRSGRMSTEAVQDLVAAGVTNLYELEGGFIAWNDAGLPLEMQPAG